jgi:biotin operon repressor
LQLSEFLEVVEVGAFTDLFKIGNRKIPRISILEAFAENPDDPLSAPDIIKMTGVSRRGVYMIISDLANDGILVKVPKERGQRTQYYGLNPNDARAANLSMIERLLNLGSIESRNKEDREMPTSVISPNSILNAEISKEGPCIDRVLSSGKICEAITDGQNDLDQKNLISIDRSI